MPDAEAGPCFPPSPGHSAGLLDPTFANALEGTSVPLLFDTNTGRAITMLVTVKCSVTLEERETGKILYHADNFVFRNEYEIPTVVTPSSNQVNPGTLAGFFEEQDPALDRLAQDFAARLVAAVTEDY